MTETFAKDFINAQSEIGTLPKDKNGYGYKYTDFDTVLTTVKPILKKKQHGLYPAFKHGKRKKRSKDNPFAHERRNCRIVV